MSNRVRRVPLLLAGIAVGLALAGHAAALSIHDIQGQGATSPMVGLTVSVQGVITARTSNGFFLQEPDPSVDADPLTSEGIFVFTSSAPPGSAAIGNQVQVTGTVAEFVPASDPSSPPETEIITPTVAVFSTGNPLPTPIPLDATLPDQAGAHDKLERVEGMRVTVGSLTVVTPTDGNTSTNESDALVSSRGVFFGTVTGVTRPFREPGIAAPDPPPAGTGTIPPIPRWDGNPELIRVDSDAQIMTPALDVATGAVVTGISGPLAFVSRRYTILRDSGTGSVASGATPTAAPVPDANEITIASFNLQRFCDTAPGGAVTMTPAGFERRLAKVSLAIRNLMRTPDIIGTIDIENLPTLQAIAARLSADAVAAAQPDPQYQAYLVEGSDPMGLDVGLLVKTAALGGAPRVYVYGVNQRLAASTFSYQATPFTTFDQPPLELVAAVKLADGGAFPLTVIVTQLVARDGIADATAYLGATYGHWVRARRQAQAVEIANYVQGLQAADATRRVAIVGEFEAFEFNDGYGHPVGVIRGVPVPDNQTATAGDGTDLVNPDLVNLTDAVTAAQRYQYVTGGSAQVMQHVLIDAALVAATTARRVEYPRFNADFPETDRNSSVSATRVADSDPAIAYLRTPASVTVDGASSVGFRLGAITPNPAAGAFRVTFTLTHSEPARIDVFDLDGRLVDTGAIDAPGEGSASITLGARRPLPVGVYQVRLSQGTRRATTRAIVIR